jgi:filamentous hemagglutinin family protein
LFIKTVKDRTDNFGKLPTESEAMKKYLSVLVSLTCLTLNFSFNNKPVKAQVSADNTLPTPTEVTPTATGVEINGGTTRGGNLFHSFKDFSVSTGSEAFFDNAPDVVNILNRVTGGNISNINGLLRANGSANLFLINPAGIIFGEGASLNIGGSFYGSTADSILFPDGVAFSATDTQVEPVLTINAPIGLGFRDSPGNITVNNSTLKLNKGKTLSLTGGNISIDGGKLFAPGGRVELGGLSAVGTVNINENGSLIFPDGVVRSDISLNNGASVNVLSDEGGFITVNARDLKLLNGTDLLAGIVQGLGVQGGEINITADFLSLINGSIIQNVAFGIDVEPGDINIQVKDATLLEGFPVADNQGQKPSQAIITNVLAPNSTGRSGNISIETGSLTLKNGGFIFSSNLGKGDGGDIKIQAENTIRLDGVDDTNLSDNIDEFVINDNVASTGVQSITQVQGNSGNIQISAGSLEILDGASVISAPSGQGKAGNIDINVRGAMTLAGDTPAILNDKKLDFRSSINTSTGTSTVVGSGQAIGNSGNINLKASSLFLNESEISTSTSAQGNAGKINLEIDDFISLNNNSLILSLVNSGGNGKGGDINIQTATLTLTDGSRISASLAGESLGLSAAKGKAGNINITATDSVNISGFNPTVSIVNNPFNSSTTTQEGLESSGIFVATSKGSTGNAGTITLSTGALRLADGGLIVASTGNESSAGDITINANNLEAINGGQILATTKSGGNGGNLNLNIADNITITGSDPTYANRKTQLPDRVNNQGAESAILAITTADSTGNGGNIAINSSELTIVDNGKVAVDNQGQGNGGIVSIRADDLTLNDEASISASTTAGEGGEIFLTIDDNLTLKNNSNITAQALGIANGGNINIDTDFIIAFPNQNNDIIANAQQGNGGSIKINAQSVFGIKERPLNSTTNDINASSEFGLDGKIVINTPDVDPFQETTEAPENIVESDQVVAGVCDATQTAQDILAGRENTFVVNGRGGVPPTPIEPMLSETLVIDGQSIEPDAQVQRRREAEEKALQEQYPPIMTSFGAIYPARGIAKKPDGTVILTAYPTDNTQRIPDNSPNCNN